MKSFSLNAKKLFMFILALVASFALIACGDDSEKEEIEKQLQEALDSITLGNTNSLSEDLELVKETNRHNLEISWELVESDDTLELDLYGERPVLKVTPTEYEENETGEQVNKWGEGVLKATVAIDEHSMSREWDLFVAPTDRGYTIAEMMGLIEKTKVTAQGTVTFRARNGVFIEDGTGSIFVFTYDEPDAEVQPGAVVVAEGNIRLPFGQPQISDYATVEVITPAPASGYDYSKAPEVEIGEIVNAPVRKYENLGRIAKITGLVIKDYKIGTVVVSQYAIQDPITGDVAVIYNSSSNSVKNDLEQKVGEYVSITIIVDGFHSSQHVWRSYGIDGTVEDAEAPEISDEDVVNALKTQIVNQLEGKTFVDDLDLITEGNLGGTVTWSSSHPEIIANDGTFTAPDQDTEVNLTYTITSGDVVETGTVKVTAMHIAQKTIKEVIDIIDQEDRLVMTEGIIIGQDTQGYYYLADETGMVYVRHKLQDDGLVIGNKVRVVGIGNAFTGNDNLQYSRQISGDYVVTKLDDEIHPSPLTAVDVEISDFNNTITSGEFRTKIPQEELYGKLVRFNLFVTIAGNYDNVYLAESLDEEAKSILVYYLSNNYELLKEYEGLQVTVTLAVYDYHVNDGWRLGFFGNEGDIEVELTPEQVVESAKTQIEGLYKNGSFNRDLNLITTSSHGATISWSSSHLEIIANDGAFTTPDQDTVVTLTYIISYEELSEEHTLTVNALAIDGETIQNIKNKVEGTEVTLNGTVSLITNKGFFVEDASGAIYVYMNSVPSANILPGAKVSVEGTLSDYFGQPQVIDPTTEVTTVAPAGGYDYSGAPDVSIADLNSMDNTDLDNYGKVVKITGIVLKDHWSKSDYAIQDPITGEVAAIYNSTSNAVKSELEAKLGQSISIVVLVNDYHSSDLVWRHYGIEGTIEDGETPELTDEQKLNYAKTEVETIVVNQNNVYDNLDFITETANNIISGIKYTWSTNNLEIIANDGTFTSPDADTEVVITVEVFLEGNNTTTPDAEWTYTVVAKAEVEVTSGVIISQVYGGGGNTDATLSHDFIELYNTTDQDIVMDGWTIYYASKTGDFREIGSQSYTTGFTFSGTIKAKSFFLIQAVVGANTDLPGLPTPDAVTDLGIGGSGFKIALTNTAVAPSGPESANIIDFVGADSNLFEGTSAAPAPSNATAVVRADLIDTDDNGADFIIAAPEPRNSSYVD